MTILAGTGQGVWSISGTRAEAVLETLEVRAICALPGAILAGSKAGMFHSLDGGRSWTHRGLGDRQVWHIVPALDGSVYAATQPAGLFRSTDGGSSWSSVEAFESFPGAGNWCVPLDPPLPGRARAVVVDPADPRRLWVGVEVGGVMRSTDGGGSWQLTRPGGNPDIHMLVQHPERVDELYVSTGYGRADGVAPMVEGNAGMFRSTDGGRTWSYAWQGITPRYTRPLCIDPRPPHVLTVGSAPSPFSSCTDAGGAQAMLFRSDDAGANWRSLCDAAHTPSAGNFHGLAPAPDAAGSVLVGTDSGELWQVSAAAEWSQLACDLPPVFSVMAVPA